MVATFNIELYESNCREAVLRIHDTAVFLSELEQQSRQLIGGKLVATELNTAAMTLYVMEDHFAQVVFELGDSN